jgi:hypothetical protein
MEITRDDRAAAIWVAANLEQFAEARAAGNPKSNGQSMVSRTAGALTRKAVEMALAGDTTALRLCLERMARPQRDVPVQFTLPGIESAPNAAKAAGAVLEAVAPLSRASRTKRGKPSRRGLQLASQGPIGAL